jgi:hypothetical protein
MTDSTLWANLETWSNSSPPSAHYRMNEDGSIDELVDPSSLVWGPPRTVPIKENLFVASKKVIMYTCDICPAEEESLESITGDWRQPLPEGWVDLNVVANDGVRHSKHLCPKCYMSITAAILEREAEVDTAE